MAKDKGWYRDGTLLLKNTTEIDISNDDIPVSIRILSTSDVDLEKVVEQILMCLNETQ